jgi:FtsP/CotA-like multicopper oxidase with cupredoxin domain
MTNRIFTRYAMGLALGLAALAMAAPSFAQTTYNLAAVEGTWTAPDGVTTIPMWGFVTDTGSCPTPGAWAPPVPLTVAAGDTLVINLRNCLGVPVSVFIPGQYKATTPVTFVDGQGRTRVSSFDVAAPADGGATTTPYTWSNAKEGTYLYHTGSHPQVGVQMGLYGALVVTGTGYPTVAQDQVLLYSEIDPALHAAVDDGTYGTSAYPSTFDYYPQYFLINGEAYPDTLPISVDTGSFVLLRFVNAGLKTHSPALGGGLYMTLIAEDGNLYPFSVEQYGVELPAAKTIDALVNIGADGTYALYDRDLHLMNGTATGGGMLVYLQAAAAAGAPTAVNDPDASTPDDYTIPEDGSLTTTAGGSPAGVLDNDTAGTGPGPMTASLVSDVFSGTLTLAANGSFIYTPNTDFNGSDQFTYVANDGGPDSNVATVSITVTPVNDPPTAVADAYDAVEGTTLNVAAPGVLGNDSDIDGDPLTAATSGIPPTELTLNVDGSFSFDASALLAGDSATFDYVANDGTIDSAPATVTINVVAAPANQAPVADDDDVSTPKNTVTPINVTSNDTDPDGTIDPTTVDVDPSTSGVYEASVTTQRGGTATNSGGGIVTYTPPNAGFRGTDTFTYTVNDNDGATSNVATVRVNVTK